MCGENDVFLKTQGSLNQVDVRPSVGACSCGLAPLYFDGLHLLPSERRAGMLDGRDGSSRRGMMGTLASWYGDERKKSMTQKFPYTVGLLLLMPAREAVSSMLISL